ncbi:MAG: large conductance mechanosensitive channel protein MscL [Planctomycetota bacterium]
MGLVKEFREFAMKGNVVDLAVGVIIGGAFGDIVKSLIKDVIMPVVGLAGNVDFSNQYLALSSKVSDANAAALKVGGSLLSLEDARKQGGVMAWGSFATITINFVIMAFCIFMVIKLMNTARKRFEKQQEAAPPPPPARTEVLLEEIRNLLAKGR